MKDKEIEIQVRVSNVKPLLEFLDKEAEFKYENHQIDKYFTPADRNFTDVRPVEEWLRLRDSNGKYSINYKRWHYDDSGKSHYCDEYESKIEDIDQVDKIFSSLGFKSLTEVDKNRKVWEYEDYEISLDSVKELGEFVEIEYKAEEDDRDPADITAEMIEFLKERGCGKIERNYVGYPYQLLFPDEVEFEEQ
ncbi:MAG: class IV adenylate cyclase [Patescibacteria group bacterium]